jgi:microcystin-dependent protein
MSDPFLAEIRIFGFNFAPTGWAQCNGQLMPLSQNTALFSLLGTTYGGDGKSNFALPNLEGSAPMHAGQGQGLSQRFLGEQSGEETVTLLVSEIPAHTHNILANAAPATFNAPANDRGLSRSSGGNAYKGGGTNPDSQMAFQEVTPTGSSFPHNNVQLSLVLNFCIALQGVFPARQ